MSEGCACVCVGLKTYECETYTESGRLRAAERPILGPKSYLRGPVAGVGEATGAVGGVEEEGLRLGVDDGGGDGGGVVREEDLG